MRSSMRRKAFAPPASADASGVAACRAGRLPPGAAPAAKERKTRTISPPPWTPRHRSPLRSCTRPTAAAETPPACSGSERAGAPVP
eukprot:9318831-Lingulodinium_polyedra.AAC.1